MKHGERAAHRSNKRRELDSKRCKKVKSAPTSKFAKKLTHQVERQKARAETQREIDLLIRAEHYCRRAGDMQLSRELNRAVNKRNRSTKPEERQKSRAELRKPEPPEPVRRMMECDDCGNQQEDMGKGVVCEACDGPLPVVAGAAAAR